MTRLASHEWETVTLKDIDDGIRQRTERIQMLSHLTTLDLHPVHHTSRTTNDCKHIQVTQDHS